MDAAVGRVLGHLRSLPLVGLVATFTLAELADFVTGLAVSRELNPIAAPIVHQPVISLALKLALIAFVVATVEISGRARPGLARAVLVVGILAGVVGAFSNT